MYSRLSQEQRDSFEKVVVAKLQESIGGDHGELAVLAEYISAMLQAGKPQDSITDELKAFMQDRSATFVDWLFRRIARLVEKGEASSRKSKRQRQPLVAPTPQPPAEPCSLLATAAGGYHSGPTVPVQMPTKAITVHRSRSRRRHRRREQPLAPLVIPTVDVDPGRCRITLTPNAAVQRELEREAAAAAAAASATTAAEVVDKDKWQYRAPPQGVETSPVAAPSSVELDRPLGDFSGCGGYYRELPLLGGVADIYRPRVPDVAPAPAPALVPADYPVAHGAYEHAGSYPLQSCGAAEPLSPQSALRPQQPQPASPQWFTVKKWRVAKENTIVRTSEVLDSPEVQTLHLGEIVEQVAPACQLPNGIVRLQIRHPSSPQFPDPIGWVTQDASPAGGPVFLEPGPEPVIRQGVKTIPVVIDEPSGTRVAGVVREDPGLLPPGYPPRGHFQNLVWKASPVAAATGTGRV